MLRQVIMNHGLPLPKGKKMEDTFMQLMNLIYHGDYPLVLNQIIQLSSEFLDELVEVHCGPLEIEELNLSEEFWKSFVSATKKNAAKALDILREMDPEKPKEAEKVFLN